MGAYFVDIDGTLFKHGTNEFLPGTEEFLEQIEEGGHQLILVTSRGQEFESHPIFDPTKTLEVLKRMGIKYDHILFGIQSPRTVINDEGSFAINCITNVGVASHIDSMFIGQTNSNVDNDDMEEF